MRLQPRLPGGARRAHSAASSPPASCSANSPRSTATRPCADACAHYAAPDLLLIDEVGYLSYSNRHADLLFELVSRRYQHKSTLVTTNRAFAEWGEVFPNAACVVSLIDRLMHRAEVVRIEGESYRKKEADARLAARAGQRAAASASATTTSAASVRKAGR